MNASLLSRGLAVLLFVLGAAGVGSPDARAQEFGRIAELETNVAYFYHARPGEPTVQVSVWGTVPQPGIYEVPDTTELDKLLTMAGGAPLQPRTERQDPPKITVRLFRPEQRGRSLLFEAPLDSMLSGQARYPSLRDNDVLVVDTVRPSDFTWRDALSLTSTALSFTVLILRIIDLRN